MARLGAMAGPADLAGLTLVRPAARSVAAGTGPGGGGADAAAAVPEPIRAVEATRFLLARQGELACAGRPRDLRACSLDGRPHLLVVDARGLHIYDVADPALPALRHQWLDGSLRGALAWRPIVLAWGREGLWRVLPGEGQPPADACRTGGPVLAVADAGAHLYVLRPGRLAVCDHDLVECCEFRVEGAMHLGLARSALAVGSCSSVAVYDVGSPRPARAATYQFPGLERIVQPGPFAGRAALYLRREGGGGVLLDLAAPDAPREVARHKQDPWFARSVMASRTLVALDESGTLLTFYRLISTRDVT